MPRDLKKLLTTATINLGTGGTGEEIVTLILQILHNLTEQGYSTNVEDILVKTHQA